MSSSSPYDLLCCGFGPASLALAIALVEPSAPAPIYSSLGGLQEALTRGSSPAPSSDEGGARRPPAAREDRPLKVCFVEKHDKFKWHPGMMLEGSNMQICTSLA